MQGDEGETDSDSVVENLSCVEIDKFLEEVSQRAVEACGDVERAVPLHVSSSKQSPVRFECILGGEVIASFLFLISSSFHR